MGRWAYTPEQNAWLTENYPRLTNRELAEAFVAEVERCKAMQGIAREINTSAKTVLETARMRAEMECASKMVAPKMLEG